MVFAVRLVGSLAAVAALLWPMLALLIDAAGDAGSGNATMFPSGRVLTLFAKSLAWSVGAALLALLLSLPVARAIGQTGIRGFRGASAAAWAVILLLPTMVTTLGWDRILPTSTPAEIRLLLIWALWIWPVAALTVGTGWARHARGTETAARLDGSTGAALYLLVLRSLSKQVGLALLISVALLLADYNAPHAAGMTVFATEMLGIAANTTNRGEVLIAALPSVAVVVLVTVPLSIAVGRSAPEPTSTPGPAAAPHNTGTRLMHFLLIGASVVLPLGALSVILLREPGALAETWRTYRGDLGWTLLVATSSALLAVTIGITCARGRAGGALLGVALLMGLAPGALTGSAMIAAYNRAATALIYDNLPILVFAGTARYAWVPILGFRLLVRRGSRAAAIEEQAVTDGTDERSAVARVLLGAHRGSVLGTGIIVAAFVMGEAAAMSLVRVPGFTPVSLVMIEKFHRAEDGILLSLGLWEAALVIACGIVISRLFSRD